MDKCVRITDRFVILSDATSLAAVSSAAPLPPTEPDRLSPLWTNLLDDAALFPPGDAAMPDAIAGYLAMRDSPHAQMLGAFLCPASRLPELITELGKAKPKEPVRLSLVIDTGLGGVPKAISIVESRTEVLDLKMVEMPAPSDVDEVWLERVNEFVPEDVTKVVEVRRGGPWMDGISMVTGHGLTPKLRCGGQRKENFPSVDEVADFLAVVSHTASPFKATAGLGRAVRAQEGDFTHYGFLNMLVATGRSLSGQDVRAALAEPDGAALAEEIAGLSEAAARAVRGVFASYGARSLTDPVDDLTELGLL